MELLWPILDPLVVTVGFYGSESSSKNGLDSFGDVLGVRFRIWFLRIVAPEPGGGLVVGRFQPWLRKSQADWLQVSFVTEGRGLVRRQEVPDEAALLPALAVREMEDYRWPV